MSATKFMAKRKVLTTLLFAVACLNHMIGSKLVIEGPDPLFTVFSASNGEIKAQYANFGHIPYG